MKLQDSNTPKEKLLALHNSSRLTFSRLRDGKTPRPAITVIQSPVLRLPLLGFQAQQI
jgi:hypothetical protein